MNAFERAETKAQLLRREFLPMWTAVRSAVEDLIGSYNRTEKGRFFPAVLRSQEGDRAVIVTCDKGLANDRFNHVTVTIRISLHEEAFEIVVLTERWLSRQDHDLMQESTGTETFRFDGDLTTQSVWLLSNGDRRLSAYQCAETFLVAALQ
jgi:hypothetical protein